MKQKILQSISLVKTYQKENNILLEAIENESLSLRLKQTKTHYKIYQTPRSDIQANLDQFETSTKVFNESAKLIDLVNQMNIMNLMWLNINLYLHQKAKSMEITVDHKKIQLGLLDHKNVLNFLIKEMESVQYFEYCKLLKEKKNQLEKTLSLKRR